MTPRSKIYNKLMRFIEDKVDPFNQESRGSTPSEVAEDICDAVDEAINDLLQIEEELIIMFASEKDGEAMLSIGLEGVGGFTKATDISTAINLSTAINNISEKRELDELLEAIKTSCEIAKAKFARDGGIL